MIRSARAWAEASRFGSFIVVVAVFVVVGPPIGSVVVWLVTLMVKPPSEAEMLVAVGSLILLLIFGYILGFGFALIAGVVVGAAGIWMQQNGILVAVGAALAAAVVGAIAQRLFISAMWGDIHAWGVFPICLVPTLVCWYITRSIVRTTWSSSN
jgi:hypothetical protein